MSSQLGDNKAASEECNETFRKNEYELFEPLERSRTDPPIPKEREREKIEKGRKRRRKEAGNIRFEFSVDFVRTP